MNRRLIVVFLLLGAGSAARAQEAVPDSQAVLHNVAAEFSALPAGSANSFQPAAAGALAAVPGFAPLPASPSSGNAAPEASPVPAPDPRVIYGGRGAFLW